MPKCITPLPLENIGYDKAPKDTPASIHGCLTEYVGSISLTLGDIASELGYNRALAESARKLSSVLSEAIAGSISCMVPLRPVSMLNKNHTKFDLYRINEDNSLRKLHSDCWFSNGLIHFTLEPRISGREPDLSYTLPLRDGLFFLDISGAIDFTPA